MNAAVSGVATRTGTTVVGTRHRCRGPAANEGAQ